MLLEEKIKFLRFWSFQFCPASKIKNSEILESVLLSEILTAFRKSVFSKEKGWSLVFLLLILSHIFPENFIEVPQVVQKIWKFSCSILTFAPLSRVFWHFLVTTKLMTSAYNRWSQQNIVAKLTMHQDLAVSKAFFRKILKSLIINIDFKPCNLFHSSQTWVTWSNH